MISYAQQHPWPVIVLVILLGYMIFLALALRAGTIRAKSREDYTARPLTVKQQNEKILAEIDFHDEQTVLDLEHPLPRIPMQSRFVPDDEDTERSNAVAAQIVSDQYKAKGTIAPGRLADAPAPGEPGYQPPEEVVSVPVGPYTVWMMRNAHTAVSEARMDGTEGQKIEVGGGWEPVVVALAMEVLRLREGWDVTKP